MEAVTVAMVTTRRPFRPESKASDLFALALALLLKTKLNKKQKPQMVLV